MSAKTEQIFTVDYTIHVRCMRTIMVCEFHVNDTMFSTGTRRRNAATIAHRLAAWPLAVDIAGENT